MKSRTTLCCALLVMGFLLSWLPLVLQSDTIPVVDELFQALEPGHRIAFGFGMVPWEFDYAARSWALGYVAAIPMMAARLLGQGPAFYIPLTWAVFALGAAGMILCTGLWAERFYGRLGALAAAVVTASWIDNLYFGGRALSEITSAHLLILAVYLAEPGYKVENRTRLRLAGLLAMLACVLRLQLAPVALLLWLWRWRDRPRLLLLSTGAVVALALNATFDMLTWSYPFQPLWQNTVFNLLLGGASSYGTESVWWYFEEIWLRWGLLTLPFLGLVLLGTRRLPLLGWMSLLAFAIHLVIPHKEYRFILPAVMMASILCGLGLVEAAQWLAAMLRKRLGETARAWAAGLMGLLWLAISAGNLNAMTSDPAWEVDSSLLETTLAISRLPAVCGVGYANIIPWHSGGYTFLHQPVPMYFGSGTRAEQDAFFVSQKAYNVLVLRRPEMAYYDTTPLFDGYKLLQCYGDHCLLMREGRCTDAQPPHPAIGRLSVERARDPLYPYAVGVAP